MYRADFIREEMRVEIEYDGYFIEYLGEQRYHLLRLLGEGGMARVYLARDTWDNREVAIKIWRENRWDQATLDRFMAEGLQVARLQHPSILQIYEPLRLEQILPGKRLPLPYIVMEYAHGGDLQRRLTPGQPFPLAATFRLFRQLCEAVQYAYDHRIIHRDIKPLNILFRQSTRERELEEMVLSDFGLAIHAGKPRFTLAHAGTLAYMAPEQREGHALPASDIFALGVTLYQLCTGHLPFSPSMSDEEDLPIPPSQRNRHLPSALDAPILRALHAKPTERYRNAREFWESLVAAFPGLEQAHAFDPQAPDTTQPLTSQDQSRPAPQMLNQVDLLAQQERSTTSRHSGQVSQTRTSSPSIITFPSTSNQRQANSQRTSTTHSHTTNLQARGSQRSVPEQEQPAAQRPHQRSRISTPRQRLWMLLLIALLLVALTGAGSAWFFFFRPLSTHLLTFTTLPLSHTSTIPGITNGAAASGTLTFINQTPAPIILAGTTLFTQKSIAIYFKGPVPLPADNSQDVQAFAVAIGVAGNIKPYEINQSSCCHASVSVRNTAAFTGGKDKRGIQQSDINTIAHPLIAAQTQSARAHLQAQLSKGESIVAGSVHCQQPIVTHNHNIGDIASVVTVKVSITCSAEAT